jgi:flagellar biosynthetic protein FlhB
VPLARAVHAACKLGQEIPAELYQAVAVVLAFVAALRRRGATKGVHALPSPALPAGPRRAAPPAPTPIPGGAR